MKRIFGLLCTQVFICAYILCCSDHVLFYTCCVFHPTGEPHIDGESGDLTFRIITQKWVFIIIIYYPTYRMSLSTDHMSLWLAIAAVSRFSFIILRFSNFMVLSTDYAPEFRLSGGLSVRQSCYHCTLPQPNWALFCGPCHRPPGHARANGHLPQLTPPPPPLPRVQ